MHDGFPEQPHQQRQAVGSAAGQKGRPTRQHEFQRIQGGFDAAPGCGAALESHKRRRAVLKGGQAVGAVVMDDDGDIDVSLGGKDQVLKSFSVRIAVAGEADDLQSWLRDFYSLGYGKGSAVDAIETVDVEIIHDLCMTADPRDDYAILQREGRVLQFVQDRFYAVQDCEIAASRTPCVRGIGTQIGLAHRIASFTLVSSSSRANGRPSYFRIIPSTQNP